MLGDNDLDFHLMDPVGLAVLIINQAVELRRNVSVPMVVSLLLARYEGSHPHPRHPFNPLYDQKAATVNDSIAREIATGLHQNVTCWKHDFSHLKCQDKVKHALMRHYFSAKDGVHLNEDRQVRLYRLFKLLLRGFRMQ